MNKNLGPRSAPPKSAAEDPLAISILTMLGIRQKELREQKAAADDAALQSLLAVYGSNTKQKDEVPQITDPFALSIIAAARSGAIN